MAQLTDEQQRIIGGIMFAEPGRKSMDEVIATASTLANVLTEEGFTRGTKRFSSFLNNDAQLKKFMDNKLSPEELRIAEENMLIFQNVLNDPSQRLPFNRFENEKAFGKHPEAGDAIGERVTIGEQVFFQVPDKNKRNREIQEALVKQGFDIGEIDGIIGKRTKQAIKQFQSNNGLVSDGIVGKNTEPALFGTFGLTNLKEE